MPDPRPYENDDYVDRLDAEISVQKLDCIALRLEKLSQIMATDASTGT